MEPTIKMIQTVQGDDVKWRNLGEQELRDYFSFRMDTVVVDSSQEFQTHLGFGGAFTEAAAYVMPPARLSITLSVYKTISIAESDLFLQKMTKKVICLQQITFLRFILVWQTLHFHES